MKRFIRYTPLLLITILTLASHLSAQSPNRVALVVSFGDGDVETQCLEFSEPEITGLEVLQRAGMDVTAQVQGLGAAVCSIEETGCPSDNCFCQCAGGGTCQFWNYWHGVDGAWQFSQVGAGSYAVQDGAVEGWAWGIGAPGGGEQPPTYSFEQICALPVTDTPVPTETAVPATATHTPAPPTATRMPDPEIDFRAETATLVAGSCTILRWDVEYITAVFLNNFGVEGHGSREVCPPQTETYTLHIVHPQGEEDRQVVVSVIVPTATTMPTAVFPTPTISQPAVNPATTTPVPPTETAVPTHILTEVETVTVTAVALSQPTATNEVIPIIVPLLPTATLPATMVAAQPSTTVGTIAVAATPAAAIAAAAPASPIPPTQWLSYAIFGMIVAGLGAMLLLGKRQ